MNLKLAKKNRSVSPKSWDDLYASEIIKLIRKKYSINQELAILRQRETKKAEFDEYNDYVESCKEKVKSIFESV